VAPSSAPRLVLTTPGGAFIFTCAASNGFLVARSAAERPKPTTDLTEPERAALHAAAQILLRDIDIADLESVTGLSVPDHISDHDARAILRGLLAALHPFDSRPCVSISILCHGYGHTTWRITLCTVGAVGSPWAWAGPFAANGSPRPLGSLGFAVDYARLLAAAALRFIRTGHAPEVQIHAAIAPLAATASNDTNGLTGLSGLMLALISKLVHDLLIPEEGYPPLILSAQEARYFLTTASAACSHIAPTGSTAPPQAPQPLRPLVPLGPLAPLVTRFELMPVPSNELHFTLTLFVHGSHAPVTTAALRFTAGGTLSRRTISGPFTLGSAAAPASVSSPELGFFTLAMMRGIQDLATPPDTLLATLRLSLAGLLSLIDQAHTKLTAALSDSGPLSFFSLPRFLGFRAPFRMVHARLCRLETQRHSGMLVT
jgi:hypothetical protein